MPDVVATRDPEQRQQQIVDRLVEAFSELMAEDPRAFRRKFRKMAADPFAFYRGSACVFYADVGHADDRWADERTSRLWIQGDLHAENFGTYMNAAGVLVFDVNDFDEAYLGHFTWDVKRLAASVALLCWTKAIPDDAIAALIQRYTHAYVDQVGKFAQHDDDEEFSLRLDTTDGAIHNVLLTAQLATRVALLEQATIVEDYQRRARLGPGVRALEDDERDKVMDAFTRYLDTIPESKRFHGLSYTVKDIVGRSGLGIGSAGLPAYSVIAEGHTQALENDVMLTIKEGNVAAPSRVVDDPRIADEFLNHGHRTAVSQRALQAHADPWLGHTDIDGVGYAVSEYSPYEADLDWDALSEPSDMAPALDYLGRATAKAHCVADDMSDQRLVEFAAEEAIADVLAGHEDAFVADMVTFGMRYADVVRDDHRLFVDAFRQSAIPGVEATDSQAIG